MSPWSSNLLIQNQYAHGTKTGFATTYCCFAVLSALSLSCSGSPEPAFCSLLERFLSCISGPWICACSCCCSFSCSCRGAFDRSCDSMLFAMLPLLTGCEERKRKRERKRERDFVVRSSTYVSGDAYGSRIMLSLTL